jgi:hypothetical protein
MAVRSQNALLALRIHSCALNEMPYFSKKYAFSRQISHLISSVFSQAIRLIRHIKFYKEVHFISLYFTFSYAKCDLTIILFVVR